MRDMSVYEERDGLLAEVERLRGVLDMYTAANTEALKAIEGYAAERDAALATIERVRVMAESWAGFGDKNGFRSTMVFAAKELRAALDVPADKLTIIDTKGESRHA